MENERRLIVAVAFSLLLHVALIASWKSMPVERAVGGVQVLNASIRPATSAANQSVEHISQESVSVLAQKLILDTNADKRVKLDTMKQADQKQSSPTPLVEKSTVQPAKPMQAGRPVPGIPQQVAPKPGGVSVMLQISSGGHVGEIYWEKLPALTDEQLRRVETAIRARVYSGKMAGSTVTEIIDVRQFLNLPAQQEGPVVTAEGGK